MLAWLSKQRSNALRFNATVVDDAAGAGAWVPVDDESCHSGAAVDFLAMLHTLKDAFIENLVRSATQCHVMPFRVAPERVHKSHFRSLCNAM
jgi:hypothetical protein